jgi:hypothetical protein
MGRIRQLLVIEYSLLIFIMVFIITSCIDEYYPELERYEDLLVVDGTLTNGSEPSVVKLSVSSSLSSQKLIPVTEGELYITDENRTITMLSETDLGTYKPMDTTFRGEVGKTYQLHITLPNGKKYKSDVCEMNAASPIDSIYSTIVYPENSEINNEFPGLQFYIENHSEVNDTSYYLWKVSQTYKYQSTFEIDYYYVGEFFPYPNPDSLHTCWRTTPLNEILVATSGLLDPTAINQFPLHFVSTETKMLSFRYSPLVKQLSISKSAFNFYKAIEKQNIETGNLWSIQPYQILGNIHNVDDESEPVLGYFVVAGASEKRIYVNKPPLEFYYNVCQPDFESVQYIADENRDTWPIYIDDIMVLGWAMADSKSCFDCRLAGGSLTPPDFWEE